MRLEYRIGISRSGALVWAQLRLKNRGTSAGSAGIRGRSIGWRSSLHRTNSACGRLSVQSRSGGGCCARAARRRFATRCHRASSVRRTSVSCGSDRRGADQGADVCPEPGLRKVSADPYRSAPEATPLAAGMGGGVPLWSGRPPLWRLGPDGEPS